jgi:hypothetical protein
LNASQWGFWRISPQIEKSTCVMAQDVARMSEKYPNSGSINIPLVGEKKTVLIIKDMGAFSKKRKSAQCRLTQRITLWGYKFDTVQNPREKIMMIGDSYGKIC